MEIKNTLIEILKESIKIQEENENAEVGSIVYSVMRSSILEGRFEYLIGVYGKYFLLEKPLMEKIDDIEWGYNYYKEAVENIAEAGKKYMNLLGEPDIERFGQKYLILFHNEIKEEISSFLGLPVDLAYSTGMGKTAKKFIIDKAIYV